MSFETLSLIGICAVFAVFAVTVAWADSYTSDVRAKWRP
jgi:hypothetical protein